MNFILFLNHISKKVKLISTDVCCKQNCRQWIPTRYMQKLYGIHVFFWICLQCAIWWNLNEILKMPLTHILKLYMDIILNQVITYRHRFSKKKYEFNKPHNAMRSIYNRKPQNKAFFNKIFIPLSVILINHLQTPSSELQIS